jgi:hypothetical protein
MYYKASISEWAYPDVFGGQDAVLVQRVVGLLSTPEDLLNFQIIHLIKVINKK